MKKNKVTIIVPIYNVEKYVGKCLESLLKQTYENIKIWAIIDGSPDNSVKIVKQYQEMDSRILCIEKENGGYGSVLQYAIGHLQSEFFVICDPDDWLEKNAIERLYESARKWDADIVVADRFDVFAGEEEKRLTHVNRRIPEIKGGMVLEGQQVGRFAFFEPSPHSKIFRTQICRDIEFPKKVSYTDFLLYIVALNNANRICYLEEPMSNYFFDRPGNTATDKNLRKIGYYFDVWEHTFMQIKQNANPYIMERLYRQIVFMISEFIETGNDKKLFIPYKSRTLAALNAISEYKNDILKITRMHGKHRLLFLLLTNKIVNRLALDIYFQVYR